MRRFFTPGKDALEFLAAWETAVGFRSCLGRAGGGRHDIPRLSRTPDSGSHPGKRSEETQVEGWGVRAAAEGAQGSEGRGSVKESAGRRAAARRRGESLSSGEPGV